MAQPQQNVAITAPGFAGVNTQSSPLDMDPSYASIADHCVVDKFGRIASRRGFNYLTTNPQILSGNPIVSLGQFLNGQDGTKALFASGNSVIFKQNTGVPDFNLVAMTLPVAYTITASNWQMINFNDKMYFIQALHQPLVYDPLVSTTALAVVSLTPTVPGADGWPNCGHAAFGRLWLSSFDSNPTRVAWSGILNGEAWDTNGTGSLQTAEYWPNGYDTVTAITAHNDFLVIFGQNSILLYNTTSDVLNTIRLVDTIEGIGCIARDSVVPTGKDFMFIDSTGVRSLMRTTVERSVPIGDISMNVRQEFQAALEIEPNADIKGVFHHEDSFYACFLPSNPKTYVFDTWRPLPDGAARVTVWPSVTPRCAVRTIDRITYFGGEAGVTTYEGAQDVYLVPATTEGVVTTAPIRMQYYTHPLDFGSPVNLIFPKQVDVTVFGGMSGELALNWGYDYQEPTNRKTLSIVPTAGVSLWGGSAEWDTTAEWTGESVPINQLKYNVWGSGRNVKVGFDVQVLGSTLSIQELNVQVQQGRIL